MRIRDRPRAAPDSAAYRQPLLESFDRDFEKMRNLTFDIDGQEKRMLFIDMSAEGLDQPFAASGFCGQ